MNEQPGRPVTAAAVPMHSGPGMSPSIGVGAPIDAVSGKDRLRAERTALYREPPATLVLDTELPGSVMLQRREPDGTWQTLETRRVGRRGGRTRIDLPDDATSPSVFRVKFSPKNGNIPTWTSELVDA